MKKYRMLFLLFCALLSIRLGYYIASDGFAIKKIENTFPTTSEWEVRPLTTEQKELISKICLQNFYYLTKGSQAYAFVSEDDAFILKLFKCYHLKPATWLENMPLKGSLEKWKNSTLEKRKKKIATALNSYKIAAQSLEKECGLIYLQILPSSSFHQHVRITDKLGRGHSIDLGQYGFILQRKAQLIYPTLGTWIKHNQIDDAKKALLSLVQLLVQRSLKGIQDSDPDLHKNAGFIGTDAVFIDVGGFQNNTAVHNPAVYKHDLYKITKNLRQWLKIQSPELNTYLEEQIECIS